LQSLKISASIPDKKNNIGTMSSESEDWESSVHSFAFEEELDVYDSENDIVMQTLANRTDRPYELNFTSLKFPEAVTKCMDGLIEDTRELTALDEPEACLLQRHYRWQLSDLTEQWFNDHTKVCQAVGIIGADSRMPSGAASSSNASPTPSTATPTSSGIPVDRVGQTIAEISGSQVCDVCFDTIDLDSKGDTSYALPCMHRFCGDCWKGYLENAVREGPTCLYLKCMYPKCTLSVRWNLFHKYCDEAIYKKFEEFKQRNFIENNPCAKWCPEPGCEYAILVKEPVQTIEMRDIRTSSSTTTIPPTSSSKEVVCSGCGWCWCFVCNEEAHRGISCQTVKRWIEKNQDEAENVAWILANTKPCPKCKNPIEKNLGCMHMVCRCGHQFCWLCSEDDHNYGHTRDGRPCNKYLESPDVERESSQRNLARYAHYFERYRSHDHAQKIAEGTTRKDVKRIMEMLQKQTGNWMDVTFLDEALQQLIVCRRMLKWTYAQGYFATYSEKDKDFFEFQQGQLEQKVDQLQAEFEKFEKPKTEDEEMISTTVRPGSNSSKDADMTDDGQFRNNLEESDAEREERFYNLKCSVTNLTKVVDRFFGQLCTFFETYNNDLAAQPETKEVAPPEQQLHNRDQLQEQRNYDNTIRFGGVPINIPNGQNIPNDWYPQPPRNPNGHDPGVRQPSHPSAGDPPGNNNVNPDRHLNYNPFEPGNHRIVSNVFDATNGTPGSIVPTHENILYNTGSGYGYRDADAHPTASSHTYNPFDTDHDIGSSSVPVSNYDREALIHHSPRPNNENIRNDQSHHSSGLHTQNIDHQIHPDRHDGDNYQNKKNAGSSIHTNDNDLQNGKSRYNTNGNERNRNSIRSNSTNNSVTGNERSNRYSIRSNLSNDRNNDQNNRERSTRCTFLNKVPPRR